MPVTSTPIFPQTVKNFVAQLLPGTGTGKLTFITGGPNGTKIEAISVASTDTVSRDVQFILTFGLVDYILGTVTIPASSGFSGSVPAVDILRSAQWPGLSYDAAGNKILYVANGAILSVKSLTAVTAAKEIDVFGFGGDY